MTDYIVSELALNDLAEIRHYIATDNPAAADRVIAGFFQRFEMLAKQPQLGALQPEIAGGGLRIYSVGNYAIVYRAAVDLEIARVLHGARDLASLLS